MIALLTGISIAPPMKHKSSQGNYEKHVRDQKKQAPQILPTFCTITDVFGFSSRIFHLMTRKINHDDRNGHFACNFLHCEAIISSFAIVTGLQSRLLLEKTEVQKCLDTKNVVLGIENVINMTAVMILVILLIILNI